MKRIQWVVLMSLMLSGILVGTGLSQSTELPGEGSIVALQQDSSRGSTQGEGKLSIESLPTGARVYLDSALIGVTPIHSIPILQGVHIIQCVPPSGNSWLTPAISDTFTIAAGEDISRSFEFPTVYHITSEPYSATVGRRDGGILGETPLYLPLLPSTSRNEILTITKPGYEPYTVPLTEATTEVHVVLTPLVHDATQQAQQAALYLRDEQTKSSLPLYVSTAGTILGGVAAAYWKTRADSYYDDYRRTGSQSSLDRVNQLDVLSGISLGISQLSLFYLTYHLLSR